MEFQKKREVQYLDGNRVMHTFSQLSGDQRDDIFGEYLDMKQFMKEENQKKNPMEFVKDGKNILRFTTDILKASCKTLDTNNIPSSEKDELFDELGDFIITGGLKN